MSDAYPVAKRWLDTKEAAVHTGKGYSTLCILRMEGKGPKYVKSGSNCLYDTRDLDEWMEQQKVDPSTKQPVAAVKRAVGRPRKQEVAA